MAKPPPSPPNSDIDGVHREERRNTDVASDLGDTTADLERAHDQNAARPPYSDDADSKDDRAR